MGNIIKMSCSIAFIGLFSLIGGTVWDAPSYFIAISWCIFGIGFILALTTYMLWYKKNDKQN